MSCLLKLTCICFYILITADFESNSQKRAHVPLTSFSTTCTQLYDDPQEILPNLDHNSASTDHIYHIVEANNSDLGRKECTTSEPVVDYEVYRVWLI